MKFNLSKRLKEIKKINILIVISLIVFPICIISVTSLNQDKTEIKVDNSNLLKAVSIERLIKEDKVLSTFVGTMTAYGYDCVGCSGYVGCAPYQWVGDGNIYYEDATYGKVRIVAADRSVPCGSILKIDSSKSDELIYAVVLDRGGAIGFNKRVQIDLLMNNEAETIPHGLAKGTKADILRYGW